MIIREFNPMGLYYTLWIYDNKKLINRVNINACVIKDETEDNIISNLKEILTGNEFQEIELRKQIKSIKKEIVD